MAVDDLLKKYSVDGVEVPDDDTPLDYTERRPCPEGVHEGHIIRVAFVEKGEDWYFNPTIGEEVKNIDLVFQPLDRRYWPVKRRYFNVLKKVVLEDGTEKPVFYARENPDKTGVMMPVAQLGIDLRNAGVIPADLTPLAPSILRDWMPRAMGFPVRATIGKQHRKQDSDSGRVWMEVKAISPWPEGEPIEVETGDNGIPF